MIRGSDGLDYEDLGARLIGELAKTSRNRILGPGSRHDEAFKADYRETYDHYEAEGYPPEVCHRSGFARASLLESAAALLRTLAGDFRAQSGRALYDAFRSGAITLYSGESPSGSPGGAGSANPGQTPPAALRSAPESPVRRGLGPQGHLPAPGEVQR